MTDYYSALFYGDYYPVTWYNGYDELWAVGRPKPHPPLVPKPDPPPPPPVPKENSIELKMPFCCDACVDKVHKKLKQMDGVSSIDCYIDKQKVIVRGTAKPDAVLKVAKKILNRTEIWKK